MMMRTLSSSQKSSMFFFHHTCLREKSHNITTQIEKLRRGTGFIFADPRTTEEGLSVAGGYFFEVSNFAGAPYFEKGA